MRGVWCWYGLLRHLGLTRLWMLRRRKVRGWRDLCVDRLRCGQGHRWAACNVGWDGALRCGFWRLGTHDRWQGGCKVRLRGYGRVDRLTVGRS